MSNAAAVDFASYLGDSGDPEFFTSGYYGDGDAGGFFDSIASAVSSVAHAVASPVSSVGKAIGSAAEAVGHTAWQGTHLLGEGLGKITNNPLWNIVATGASFIPGVGSAVSAGMAGAAAIGRGESLSNIGLAAARSALPGGPVTAAAFDIASGLLKGQGVTDSVLQAARSQVPGGEAGKAAFDAAVSIGKGHGFNETVLQTVRANIPSGVGKTVFDSALANFRGAHTIKAPTQFPSLSHAQKKIANTMQGRVQLMRVPAASVASAMDANHNDVRKVIATFVNHFKGQPVYDWQDVGSMDSVEAMCDREGVEMPTSALQQEDAGALSTFGHVQGKPIPKFRAGMSRALLHGLYQHAIGTVGSNIRKAMLAHGLQARVAHQTGELDGAGGWVIRSGDTGSGVAKKVTGNANRWRELLPVNPGMKAYTASNGSTQITGWNIGKRITLPASWLGTAAPMPTTPVGNSPNVTDLTKAPMIKKGDSGIWVTVWQSILGISADGQFGSQTEAATKAWQTARGLDPDGIVGPMSWGKAALEKAGGVGPVPNVPIALPQITPVTLPPIAMPPIGPAVPNASDIPATAAVQVALASFTQIHGAELIGSPSPTFGSDIEDLAGVWNDRSHDALLAFQRWHNTRPGTPLPETGMPDQTTVNALVAQVTADVNKTMGTNIPAPPMVGIPVTLPPVLRPPVPGSAAPPKPPATVPGATPPGGVAPKQAGMGGSGGLGLVLAAGIAVAMMSGGGRGSSARKRAA